MTEILLKEEWINENQSADIENKKLIIESLLNDNTHELDFLPKNLASDAKCIATAKVDYEGLDFSTRKNIIRYAESNIANNKLLVSFLQNEFILIYLDSSYENIEKHLKRLVSLASKSYNVKLAFGVSNNYYNLSNTKHFICKH